MLKVGCSALVVGQTAIIEHLEENIEDLGSFNAALLASKFKWEFFRETSSR